MHGLAPCQAGTLQLTVPVCFLKRRASSPSQLFGCETGRAHSCIYFHCVPAQGGNCNSALDLKSLEHLVSPEILCLSFIHHSDLLFLKSPRIQQDKQQRLWQTPCGPLLVKTKPSCRALSGETRSGSGRPVEPLSLCSDDKNAPKSSLQPLDGYRPFSTKPNIWMGCREGRLHTACCGWSTEWNLHGQGLFRMWPCLVMRRKAAAASWLIANASVASVYLWVCWKRFLYLWTRALSDLGTCSYLRA